MRRFLMLRRIHWAILAMSASFALNVILVGGEQPPSPPTSESAEAELAAPEKQIIDLEQELAELRNQAATLRGKTGSPPTTRSEENAVRVLLRQTKSKLDGTNPPPAWPEMIRRNGRVWVVDIDTSQLPSGYPEQIVVEVSVTGGHTDNPKR